MESIQTEKVTQETYSSLVKIEHKNHDLEKSSKLLFTAPYKDKTVTTKLLSKQVSTNSIKAVVLKPFQNERPYSKLELSRNTLQNGISSYRIRPFCPSALIQKKTILVRAKAKNTFKHVRNSEP